MKTRKLLSLMIVGTAIVFTSCKKQPEAEFTTDKEEYIAGEKVRLTNTSVDGVTYNWILPNGETLDSKDVNYTLAEDRPDGTINFTLEAFSKKEKKKDSFTKSVKVKAAVGSVVFWQAMGSSYGTTNVTISSEVKQITLNSNPDPNCGTSGCATFDLKVGHYSYTATDGVYSWSGAIDITKDGCLSYWLQ